MPLQLATITFSTCRALRIIAIVWVFFDAPAKAAEIHLELPKTRLAVGDLAVVVNDADPMSAAIAEYYREQRGIPHENILHVRFASNGPSLPRNTFKQIRESVIKQTAPNIQAYALAWTRPYRVDCMSITSAFAFGFDEAFCSSSQCAATKSSAYFDSASHAPYTDYGIRPAMLLAGKTLVEVKRMIDRGVESDYSYPDRTGYLLNTENHSRSVRTVFFDYTLKKIGQAFHLERMDTESIQGKQDVLFYFTGGQWIKDLPSLHFVPGAIADHLTSFGGDLDGGEQMSSLRWLEAGATGSFGTVVEPCNHVQKFPIPPVVIWHYAEGDTLIEAYWKSVAWPGEGLFIGEPLAHPFAPSLTDANQEQATLKIYSPSTKQVQLEESESPIGPYRTVANYSVAPGLNRIKIQLPEKNFYHRIKLE